MRKILIFSFFQCLICLVACNSLSPEEEASKAAKEYYDLLVEGDAVRFLENKMGIDTLSADYGEQLLAAVRQYQQDIQKKHGGLREVRISENMGRPDTVYGSPFVHAFLLLSYADSTQEEITVPMVERDGRWLMK
jgi:hypothetical protein